MKTATLISILLGFLFIASACSAGEELMIEDAWARPGFRGDNSAVYLVINNPTETGDGLIGASTDIAGMAEIHLSSMDDAGTMTMERQNLVPIPANELVELSPGGLHIMLVNLGRDLTVGDTFQLSLEFQRAGDMTVEVEINQP
jgi:copper(I)-binding protein